MADVKIWESVLIHKDRLRKDPKNTNKQSKKTFKALRENIRTQGLDEPLIVVPDGDDTYTIYSGNHRFEAGCLEGIIEFPCIVRDDWDAATAYMQSVRRNYSRGAVDKNAFALVADQLKMEYELSQEEVTYGMGFDDDIDVYASMYEKPKTQGDRGIERSANTNASKVKLMDDVGLIVSHIMENYGDTAPYSFLIFPAGNKHHMFVQSTNALKNVIQKIAATCIEKQLDINTALAGLLNIGASSTNFFQKKEDVNTRIQQLVAENTEDPDDTDLEPMSQEDLDT